MVSSDSTERAAGNSAGGGAADAAPADDAGRAARRGTLLPGLIALAGAAAGFWFFYAAAGRRERGLWHVFRFVARPIEWGSGDWRLGAAVVASVVLTCVAGAVVLLAMGVRRASRPEALALSYLLGIGFFGLLGELLAMAHLMEAAPLWLCTGMSSAVAAWWILGQWRRRGDGLAHWDWLGGRARDHAPGLANSESLAARLVAWALVAAIGAILLLCAFHALLFPVVYWDAMILYVGYAREMFLAGGVVEKIVGQVGYGLGANYPHLFSFHHLAMAKMAGLGWSTVYAQSISPLCAAAVAVLGTSLLRRLGFTRLVALGAVLLMTTMPYYIAYVQYASNYLLAVALTSMFLWGAACFLRTRDWPSLGICFAAAALAVHVNYLMWALWLAGAVLVFVCLPMANWMARDAVPPASTTGHEVRLATGRHLATNGRFWLLFLAALALASPWYVRNVIKTGNPVYAFFHNIFPSKNVDPEVMESAAHEWVRNGDGIGIHALQVRGGDDHSFADKIRATPSFFATGNQAYKLAPAFLGFCVPGALLWLLAVARGRGGADVDDAVAAPAWLVASFGVLCYFLVGFLFFYHYGVADFYLYQIMPVVAPLVFFAAVACGALRRLAGGWGAALLLACVLAAWLVPGMAFAMMGFKVLRQPEQFTLFALHNPLMDEETFYRLRYDHEVRAWKHLNEHYKGAKILTHENRHLAFDPSIRFVHLDDWEVQALYDLPTPEAKLRGLLEMELDLYLYVPNEDKHPINKRLELDHWRGTPQMEELFNSSPGNPEANILYRLRPPGE